TIQVKDIHSGPESSSPDAFMTVGSKVFFVAYTMEAGRELWVTDGSAAGTFMLSDIVPGPQTSYPSHFFALGNKLIFTAEKYMGGYYIRELWVTDGTTVGTTLLQNGITGSYNDYNLLGLVNGKLIFERYTSS